MVEYNRKASMKDQFKKSKKMAGKKTSNIIKPDLDIQIYQPNYGHNVIDIIPFTAGANHHFEKGTQGLYNFIYEAHWIGTTPKTGVVCPLCLKGQKRCPVCEMLSKMDYRSASEKDQKFMKSYFPRKRVLYNALGRFPKEQKAKGLQVLDVAYNRFEDPLLGIAVTPAIDGEEEQIIDFVDPKRGKSIDFDVEKAKSKEDFDKWKNHKFRDRNYSIEKSILDSAYVLDEIVNILDYKEIKDILDTGLVDTKEHTGYSNKDSRGVDSALIKELGEVEDVIELDDFVNLHELESKGFNGIDIEGELDEEKKKVLSFLEKKDAKNESKEEDSSDNELDIDFDKVISEIKSCQDLYELEELLVEYSLDDLYRDLDYDEDNVSSEKEDLIDWLNRKRPAGKQQTASAAGKLIVDFDKDKFIQRLKKTKTERQLSFLLKKYNLNGKILFDVNDSFIKHKVKLRKIILEAPTEEEDKGVLTLHKIKSMDFEELCKVAKEEYPDSIDPSFYEPEEVEELREEILNYFDEIPF